MAKVSDRVTYYTHESSDDKHWTTDSLALVIGSDPDGRVLDLVVFPRGGPTIYLNGVVPFDPDNPGQPGQSYWREFGSKPPEFADVFTPISPADVDPNETARLQLAAKHRDEIAKVDLRGYVDLRLRQEKEWDDLENQIARQKEAAKATGSGGVQGNADDPAKAPFSPPPDPNSPAFNFGKPSESPEAPSTTPISGGVVSGLNLGGSK